MKVVLISTYELGRQPFGLSSPAAWLRKQSHHVTCLDLSRQEVNETVISEAQLIAFYVPMHTATRLALEFLPNLRQLNPHAHFCAYGLYAPLAAQSFQALGVTSLFGGEFEQSLVDLTEHLAGRSAFPQIHPLDSNISLARLRFQIPDRSGLPALRSYAHLILPMGQHRTVGYTEATRGCKHLCRHCPIVPVYKGVFRIVDRNVVLADIRQQVAAGAQHITFGDPDFFNGTGHAIPIVEALHREFPDLTYDVTIKVEHLLKNADLIPTLRNTGCLFVISAVESLDEVILEKLQKGHTRADFFHVIELFRSSGLALQPTFVPFTPWTTFDNYLDLLIQIRRLDLIESVAPIQLVIRLLIPPLSRILELEDIRGMIGPLDSAALVFPWKNQNPRLDELSAELQTIVATSEGLNSSRTRTFEAIWRSANRAADRTILENTAPIPHAPATVPHLNEPWYC
jgi:Radical SAM superfamily